MTQFLDGARVLITGGSGFLGQHLVRAILRDYCPESIIVFSRCEHRQASMRAALKDDRVRYFIGDVRDIERLRLAMHEVHVVIHAAAMKRVDSCASDPFEAIKTNVLGTENVIRAAIEAGVHQALFISSDKASAPLNLYGKTKACAEDLWLAANQYNRNGRPAFAAVRYGNVAGSTSSVVPIWRECLRKGVPLTVTDPGATRFWFTADGAVRLVLETLETMRGGELVVPALPSFTVGDLALAFGGPIDIIGPREGDKRHESMISADEACLFHESGDGRFIRGGHDLWPALYREYRSDTNPLRLTVDGLREELRKLDGKTSSAA